MDDVQEQAFKRIEEYARLCMWKHGTPGMVVGLTDREGSIFKSALGYSDVKCKEPLSTEMLFQIGSVSKSFTCIALLQLADEGIIDLHAPVKDYVPWFEVKSKFEDITLHHLMTHTAGIVIGSDSTPTSWTEVWDLRLTETSCKPGTFFHYSNSGYKVLGLVLETVLGEDIETILKSRVLDKVGMKSSSPVIRNEIRPKLAVAHTPLLDDRPYGRDRGLVPATWFEGDTADGAICSNLEDMLAYIRMFMNEGKCPTGSVLSPKGFESITTPYIVTEDGIHGHGYGYGLNVEQRDGYTCIGHQGGMVGYYTSMLMDMELGIGAMVMVNGPGEPDEVVRFSIDVMRKSVKREELPEVPLREESLRIDNPDRYVGTFADSERSVEITEEQSTLHLREGGSSTRLEPRGDDRFFADLKGLDRFLLEFSKEGEISKEFYYGGRKFSRGGQEKNAHNDPGAEETVYEGHYRSHNPWLASFRVVRRESGLVLILPDGTSNPLHATGSGEYRIGDESRSPERIRFDTVINGRAVSAMISGSGRFGRTFTP